MIEYRTEEDTLGKVKVPAGVYYGAQTQRAVENFPVSGKILPPAFIKAQAVIKIAAAQANAGEYRLDESVAEAVIKAGREVLDGELDDQFVVDVFQAGAGTSQNMNINEVIANRAAEILGGRKGVYDRVHPNDHVNMAQSTNDTIHTAVHIAAAEGIDKKLQPALENLENALKGKSAEFDDVLKCGRTHLQDAVPIRLGQEFSGYAAMIKKARRRIGTAREALNELCIGGTAVGTGLNTSADYKKKVIESINGITGGEYREAENAFEAMQNLDAVVEICGALRVLIVSLGKIADDFRLLSSGPRTGFGEIELPAVQPGSSIMPGKVNPVLAEMLNMVCFGALGCDTATVEACRAGQLELNVMMPVAAYELLTEIDILAGGVTAFTEKCVKGVKADRDVCGKYAEKSAALATALSPETGYHRAAEIALEALKKGATIREIVKEKGILDEKKAGEILDIYKLTEGPGKE